MAIRRTVPGHDGTFVDVLDRVLDKGIVISAWGRVSGVGLELARLEMRVVVASVEMHLRYAEELRSSGVQSFAGAWSDRRETGGAFVERRRLGSEMR